MAISNPSNLSAGNLSSTTTATSQVTGSFTPAAGALLIISAGVARGGAEVAALSISDSRGLTWTQRSQIGSANTLGGVGSQAIWTAVVPSAAAMTVTITATIAQALWTIAPYQILADRPLVVSNVGENITTGTSLVVTLPSSPAPTSLVFASITAGPQNGGVTPDAAFTEIHELVAGGQMTLQSQYDAAGADNTVQWSGLSAMAAGKYGAAFEVSEEAVVSGFNPAWAHGSNIVLKAA